jgi:hypothetical protein
MNALIIEAGDTVRIKEHRKTPSLYPDRTFTYPAEEGCVVLSLRKKYHWQTEAEQAHCVKLTAGGSDVEDHFVKLHTLELVSKGGGHYVPGVSLPFSLRELKQQRWDAFAEQAWATPIPKHCGYSNASTFLAHLYLSQCKGFMGSLPGMRRQDGSVNPNKVKKAFQHAKLVIDDWAYVHPLAVPDEFDRYSMRWRERMNINWTEVAEAFSAKNCA